MELQSAMEYIMTYSWAILILAVVMSALFTLGVFNPSTYSTQSCIITSAFTCLSFSLASNGILTINLQQSADQPLNVTAIGCTQNAIPTNMLIPYNPPTNQIYLSVGSNYTFTVPCYQSSGGFSVGVGNSYSGSVVINYTNVITRFPATVYGKLIAKVT